MLILPFLACNAACSHIMHASGGQCHHQQAFLLGQKILSSRNLSRIWNPWRRCPSQQLGGHTPTLSRPAAPASSHLLELQFLQKSKLLAKLFSKLISSFSIRDSCTINTTKLNSTAALAASNLTTEDSFCCPILPLVMILWISQLATWFCRPTAHPRTSATPKEVTKQPSTTSLRCWCASR